jgi:hypothetical protein
MKGGSGNYFFSTPIRKKIEREEKVEPLKTRLSPLRTSSL